MPSKQQWLDQGLTILAEEGPRALTIERLCTAVGLTKGSFYHHFGNIKGFDAALLAHFEESETERYVQLAEQAPATSARGRLEALKTAITEADDSSPIERSVRAWAAQDDAVAQVLERVDRRRVSYVESLLSEMTGDPRRAAELAMIIYLVLLGSYQVLPALSLADVRRLWDRVLAEP